MTEDKRKAYAMILLTQMMFERCSNDVLLPQNDVRTRANLGMALIIYTPCGVITYVYCVNNQRQAQGFATLQ